LHQYGDIPNQTWEASSQVWFGLKQVWFKTKQYWFGLKQYWDGLNQWSKIAGREDFSGKIFPAIPLAGAGGGG
jgi:hypothetical protein